MHPTLRLHYQNSEKSKLSAIIRKHAFSSNSNTDSETRDRLNKERSELLSEARLMTLSLWRTSLRCIKILRLGNEHDEKEFKEREKSRLDNFDASKMMFEMPVDRNDELSSRANYYHQWATENIQQESDCLDKDPWMEANVKRYIDFVRSGEERRKWILKEYKFEDPYPQSFDHRRLERFEKRCKDYLRETYSIRGWSLNNDVMKKSFDDLDDDFFDDVEDDSDHEND